jgi:hypothetical protein
MKRCTILKNAPLAGARIGLASHGASAWHKKQMPANPFF